MLHEVLQVLELFFALPLDSLVVLHARKLLLRPGPGLAPVLPHPLVGQHTSAARKVLVEPYRLKLGVPGLQLRTLRPLSAYRRLRSVSSAHGRLRGS